MGSYRVSPVEVETLSYQKGHESRRSEVPKHMVQVIALNMITCQETKKR
jgi:hypothetical protein